MVFLCYFWLLVSMPIILFNSLIICNYNIFELSLPIPAPPPMLCVLIIKGKEGGEGGGG